jgi:phosphoribosylformylglycinamidine synthase
MAAATEFLALAGSPASSPFRLAELKDSLNSSLAAGPKVTEVRSIHVHYVSAKSQEALQQLKQLGSEQRVILDKLLTYDNKTELSRDSETQALVKALNGQSAQDGKSRLLLYVVPRKGTISPWSSKATSIAAVCGLKDVVARIERGVLFSLVFDGEYKSEDDGYPFADVLHDRMTQVSF